MWHELNFSCHTSYSIKTQQQDSCMSKSNQKKSSYEIYYLVC